MNTNLATLATELVEFYNIENSTVAECDLKSQPLIDELISQGVVPDNRAFVEWQGVFEFNLVPVCHFDELTERETWVNVHLDGSVT